MQDARLSVDGACANGRHRRALAPCSAYLARVIFLQRSSGLSDEAVALIAQLRQRLQDQEQQLAERDALLQRKDREIALREARTEKMTFERPRLKRLASSAPSRKP